ncbi:THAP domain-containing protein 11-like isoform X3 [Rhipicephalus microplus]|uniref:THAP domain-containing protein 11-like isoform X3 n=1 Tax=Rhipicephalus microplus TaxID=6941 RepID=UPI003F6D9477
MGGFTCCVPGCYNNSTRDKGLGFYVFPKEQKLRETWIQRINRAGRGGRFSKFTPTTGHRVCGAHFEGGKKTYMNRVPTIFPLRPQKVERRRPLIRTQLRRCVTHDHNYWKKSRDIASQTDEMLDTRALSKGVQIECDKELASSGTQCCF